MGQYDRTQFQAIVNPPDGLGPFLGFLDLSYINMVRKLRYDRVHTVNQSEEGNLQLISFTYYNTIELWWILAMYNGVVNPITEVITGLRLKVPTLTSIEDYFREHVSQQASVVSLP
jgi:hypothetical protein